jgi:hypothetical protein
MPTWYEWEGKGPYAWCYRHIDVDDPDILASARQFVQRLGINFRTILLVHGGVQYSPDSDDMEVCAPCSEESPQPATWVFAV